MNRLTKVVLIAVAVLLGVRAWQEAHRVIAQEQKKETEIPGDTNGDGALDISDGIYLFDHLFRGGARPAVCLAQGTSDRIAALEGQLAALEDQLAQLPPLGELTITEAGDVGIGTPAPRSRLHVSELAAPDLTSLVVEAEGRSEEDWSNRIAFRTGTPLDLATREIAAVKAINSNLGSHRGSLAFETMEDGGSLSERVRIASDGDLGVGTTVPQARLHVSRPAEPELSNLIIEAEGQSGEGWRNGLAFRTGTLNDRETRDIAAIKAINSNEGSHHGYLAFETMEATTLSEKMRITPSGNVGIGTDLPETKLHVAGDVTCGAIDSTGTGSFSVVVIRGADVAEKFDISGGAEPGAVVAADPMNPGNLRVASRPLDRSIVGVVSGAGGVAPGLVLHQPGVADGEHPVAMVGRAYVLADASYGAIIPGDALTSSATPGHAMRVSDHQEASGAILGTALTGLGEGTGLVLLAVQRR